MPSNVLPLHLKQTFVPIIWIFTEGMGSNPGYLIKSFLIYLAVGAATIWLLDLAIFCWEEVNLVIDLWSPPLDGGRVASKLFKRVILLWVGNLPVDLLSLLRPFTVVFRTVVLLTVLFWTAVLVLLLLVIGGAGVGVVVLVAVVIDEISCLLPLL